jgi:hypothetical protein
MDNLLKEAIADAKAVRETALANAKLALEEAFTPHLKSMLSKKLQAEDEEADEVEPNGDAALEQENPFADDEEEVSEGNEADSSDIATADNKAPSDASGNTSGIGQEGDSEGSAAASGDEDENSEKAPDQAMGENSEPPMGDDEEVVKAPAHSVAEQEDEDLEDLPEEDDPDLEEVLRQLEQEMADDEEEPAADPVEQDEPEADMEMEEGEDDDIDLDEIIKALSEEDDEEDDPEGGPAEQDEPEGDPAAELEEYKKTVMYLKDKLQEVNLLNAKLLYTNKLFRSRNISETQKMKVIEQFDRATNVREVKLVYSTFAESMKRKPMNEGATRRGNASKKVASTKSNKPIINEAYDFRKRMKKLANII